MAEGAPGRAGAGEGRVPRAETRAGREDGAIREQAATVSRELADVEDRERNMAGDWHLAGLAWPELALPTPVQASRLADWQAACRAAGLFAPWATS